MNPVIAGVIESENPEQGEYDKLPLAVKQFFTPAQWAFLPDDQKATAIRDVCEPEC